MSATNFKYGDRVVRIGCDFREVKRGEHYTIWGAYRDDVSLLGLDGVYESHLFESAPATGNADQNAGAPTYNPNIGHTDDGGGLQKHSVGGPFPFVVVGIDNPTGLEPGLYWYVQDKAGKRCTPHFRAGQDAINCAAELAETFKTGESPYAPPPLACSEGYITTFEVLLTQNEHDLLRALLSHCTTGDDTVSTLLRKFGGYDKAVTALFETRFHASGDGLGQYKGSVFLSRKDKA